MCDTPRVRLLWRPDDGDLEAVRRRAETEPLTYDEVGATAWAVMPAGYRLLDRSRVVGRGEATFAAAAGGVFDFAAHRGAGAMVAASGPPAVDDVVAVALGAGPLWIAVCCRIVSVVDEPRRRGWAYGTLATHAQSGEESFTVEWRDDDTVVFHLRAFARPASRLVAVGGPLLWRIQAHATTRYLDGVERAARVADD